MKGLLKDELSAAISSEKKEDFALSARQVRLRLPALPSMSFSHSAPRASHRGPFSNNFKSKPVIQRCATSARAVDTEQQADTIRKPRKMRERGDRMRDAGESEVTSSPKDDPACRALPAILADAAVLPPNTFATRLRTRSSVRRPVPSPFSARSSIPSPSISICNHIHGCLIRFHSRLVRVPPPCLVPAALHDAVQRHHTLEPRLLPHRAPEASPFLFGGTLALCRTSVYRFIGMLMRLRRRPRDHRSESPSSESRTGAVALGMRLPVRKWAIIFATLQRVETSLKLVIPQLALNGL
ncbi:hypothetical protein FB451DRAFT_1173226 [Mycena latifolia]|nr:hypothetical protein FB451DRAFT_1173226 [Mycena latifolia]